MVKLAARTSAMRYRPQSTRRHLRLRSVGLVKGFTLTELMFVVTVIGILAMIALPTYLDQVRKARRADAKSALIDAAAREERFFANYNQYTTVYKQPASCTGAACGLGYDTDKSSEQHYQLSAAAGSTGSVNTSYMITAAPQGDQGNDTECKSFTLDSLGQKGISGGTGSAADCW
jgi:type IV pilus assembly protein PilE